MNLLSGTPLDVSAMQLMVQARCYRQRNLYCPCHAIRCKHKHCAHCYLTSTGWKAQMHAASSSTSIPPLTLKPKFADV